MWIAVFACVVTASACASLEGLTGLSKGDCNGGDCDASVDVGRQEGPETGIPDVSATTQDAGEASASEAGPVVCSDGGVACGSTCCTDQTCVGGSCQGVCAPGQTQCQGNVAQNCSSAGRWQTATTCSGTTPICTNGACVECTVGAVQCATDGGNGIQTCATGGTWGAPVACTGQTCVNGVCTGACAPGQTVCQSGGATSCTAAGQWGTPTSCSPGICSNGQCTGNCTPGNKQCSGNGVETCGANGMWGAPAACTNQTCTGAGVCSGSCGPGQTRCLANVVQACDSSGNWQSQVTCSGTTPACLNSTCVACNPGSVECNGNGTTVCTSNGNWGPTGNCAEPTPSCQNGSCVCNETQCPTTCTTLTTITNCGGCGVVCNATNASGPQCNGTTCTYTCNAGASDCNKGTPPDSDGCECATPGCCGSGCETTHSDGFGQFFYDCNPPGTYTEQSAMSACTAYTGNASVCGFYGYCNGGDMVCVVNSQTCYCWEYGGTLSGYTSTQTTNPTQDGGPTFCYCPGMGNAQWN